MRAHWGEPLFIELEAPSMKDDESLRDWLALFMRMAASPGNAVKMLEFNAAVDIRGVLPNISVPTLVLHRKGDQIAPFGGGAYMAEQIPGAQLVALEGDDHVPFVGDVDSVHRAIESFARELRPETCTPPMRVVLLAATRDGAPNAAIERVVAPIAARHRGDHIDTGKGVAFAFDGAPRAVRAAMAVAAAAPGAGLAMGVALDAGIVTPQFVERLHARAADAPSDRDQLGSRARGREQHRLRADRGRALRDRALINLSNPPGRGARRPSSSSPSSTPSSPTWARFCAAPGRPARRSHNQARGREA